MSSDVSPSRPYCSIPLPRYFFSAPLSASLHKRILVNFEVKKNSIHSINFVQMYCANYDHTARCFSLWLGVSFEVFRPIIHFDNFFFNISVTDVALITALVIILCPLSDNIIVVHSSHWWFGRCAWYRVRIVPTGRRRPEPPCFTKWNNPNTRSQCTDIMQLTAAVWHARSSSDVACQTSGNHSPCKQHKCLKSPEISHFNSVLNLTMWLFLNYIFLKISEQSRLRSLS